MKVTVCETCKSKVSYTTNKPKLCPKCRAKKEARFSKSKATTKSFRSKKEGQMQKVLNELMPNAVYVDNGYYSWMLSPKGSPLQLDRYYPDLKVAFEYNGRQHYEYNSYMHRNVEAFEYLQKCDIKKRRECRRQGIKLITIKYTKEITPEYLIGRLEEAGIHIKVRRKRTTTH